MRNLIKLALFAGAALAVSACNRQAPVANNAANEVADDSSLNSLGNDPSAVDAANAPLPTPPAIDNGVLDAPAPIDPAPEPSSTPNVESNVSGM